MTSRGREREREDFVVYIYHNFRHGSRENFGERHSRNWEFRAFSAENRSFREKIVGKCEIHHSVSAAAGAKKKYHRVHFQFNHDSEAVIVRQHARDGGSLDESLGGGRMLESLPTIIL